jgi:hypothetical protein
MSKREEERRTRLQEEDQRRQDAISQCEAADKMQDLIGKHFSDAAASLDRVAVELFKERDATQYVRPMGPPRLPGAIQVHVTTSGVTRELTKAEHHRVYRKKVTQLQALLSICHDQQIDIAALIDQVDSNMISNEDAGLNLLQDLLSGEAPNDVVKDIALMNGGLPLWSITTLKQASLALWNQQQNSSEKHGTAEQGASGKSDSGTSKNNSAHVLNTQGDKGSANVSGPRADHRGDGPKKKESRKTWTSDCDKMKKRWFAAIRKKRANVPRIRIIRQQLQEFPDRFPSTGSPKTMDKAFQNNPDKWLPEYSALLASFSTTDPKRTTIGPPE